MGLLLRWCGGSVGLRYSHHDTMVLLYHDPTVQVHLVEYGQHVILYVIPVNLKEFQTDAISSRSIVTSYFAHHYL